MPNRPPVKLAAVLAAAFSAVVIAGCGSGAGSSSHTSTVTPATAQALAEIKHNWVEFFAPSTSPSMAIQLLQDGTKFAAAITAQAKSPFAQELSATVSSVKLMSPTTATVTYTLKVGGQAVPGLKNATGTAVKSGGTWQVADSSYCKLLKLQGTPPAGCPKG